MPARPYFFRRPNLRFTPGAATLSTSTPAPTTPRSPLMRVPPRRRFTTATREGSATTTSQVILSSTTKPRYKFASRRPYLKTTSPSTSTTSEEDPNDQILDASNQKPMKNGNLQDIDSADEEIASSDEVSDIALTIHSINAAPLPTTRITTTTTEKVPTVTTLYDRIKTRKRGRISTTMSPRTTSPSATNRRRRPQPFEKVTQVPVQLTTGSYTPITVEYDYYDEGDVRILGQLPANSKVLIHSSGAIQCLDQGNFPHPVSCHKFISCAKMENNDVIGWEYTCPNRLSFDPVGGICNWSAGIGCKEN